MKRIYILLISIIVSFATAFADNPEIERLMQEGFELHIIGDFESAIEKYNEALQIDPTNIYAIYEIALSYLAMGNYANAIIYTTKVLNSHDRTLAIGAYAIQSEALAALGRPNEAITLLERALEANANEYLLHFNLALLFYKANDLENTLLHVKKTINLNKMNADAFLLYAYVLNDLGLWVQSILAFQMFLLIEPDDIRSREAFEELLITMHIVPAGYDDEWGHSYELPATPALYPPLSTINGINKYQVFNTINSVLNTLRAGWQEGDEEMAEAIEVADGIEEEIEEINHLFIEFKEVNREIILLFNDKNDGSEERTGIFWTFYVPFFTRIVESEHYETFARYISVSYFPDSFEWWQDHPEDAELFVNWFIEGDEEYPYFDYDGYYYYDTGEEIIAEPTIEPTVEVVGNESNWDNDFTTVPLIRPSFFQRITSIFRTQPVVENNDTETEDLQ